ncbi:7TMR-DISM extracellular protein 2 [Dyadobacter jejuensis]|uniref:7TMR-DISM extracellular protein 2 n=1 Tax=Dyadobacter jejuensis TaxID=1082580 RepID=A0A316ASM9_9BACT|nr:histidine kinase [Dyadobacter jejuensis]PWJ60572.1 7TMR-DISM extracellular protein 2 [Dyadobacter jejuensis]
MRSRVILLLLLNSLAAIALGQDTLAWTSIKQYDYLWKLGRLYHLNHSAAHPNQIPVTEQWTLLNGQSPADSTNYTWLKTTIKNDTDSTVYFDLDIWYADSISVWDKKNQVHPTILGGPYVDLNRWPFYEDPNIIPIRCAPGQHMVLYIRLWSDEGRSRSLRDIYVQTREESLKETIANYRSSIGQIEFNGFFLGAVCFAMIFFVFIFLKVRESLFLLYSLYLLGAAIYALLVKTLPFSFIARLAYLDYPITYKLGEPIQYLFFAAYIAFGKALLDIDQRYPALNKALKGFIFLLVIGGLSLLTYNLYHLDFLLQKKAFGISRLIILPLSIAGLIWIGIAVRSPLKWFLIVGSSFFILGGLLAIMVDPKTRHLFFGDIGLNPIILFKTGILLESLCFALALGYKIRLTQVAKEQASKDYIDQLVLNRRMAATETERLEKMVAERTAEVIEKNRLIEIQKQKGLRSDLEKKLSEMEMKALRSQMNPHFIFNSLNSIRYQILTENYEVASNYLTRFSKLLRHILQNSREHIINLDDEIEMNRLYLQLESLRFSRGFEYLFDIPDDVDTTEIIVPPMLLQPYIENAIKHGLVPSNKAQKKVEIRVSTCETGYMITIEDNGVGRQTSATHSRMHDKQSLGMIISDERIALFNDHFKSKIEVTVTDLYEDELASGTRITFIYKPEL